jgi:WD40 repeat protein
MTQGGRPRRIYLAIVACVAVLSLAAIGGLAWSLVASDGEDESTANNDPSATADLRRGVWILDPETNETEFVPLDGFGRLAQWVKDGETFIAQTGGRNDGGLYGTDGNLLQTIVDLPEEIRQGTDLSATYHAEPVPGGIDILVRRDSELGNRRTWTLFDLSTGEERPLPEFLRGASFITHSPDGEKVAYLHDGLVTWDLVVANADGSDPSILTSGPLDAFPIPEWSPDAAQLLLYADGVHRVIDLEGKEVWTSTPDNTTGYRWIAPGKLLAIGHTATPDGTRVPVAVIDVESGEPRPLEEQQLPRFVGQSSFSPDGRYLITYERDEQGDFSGFITELGLESGPSSTSPAPPEVPSPTIVDWTADSSLALLSSP